MRLKDRVALITGAGQGIGRATILRFAGEGAAVVIADADQAGAEETARLVEERGGRALAGGLMPAAFYPSADWSDDRVSCLLQFRKVREQAHNLYLPADYARALEYILGGLELSRTLEPARALIPSGSSTRLTTQFYEFAGVGRFNLQTMGEDFAAVLEAAEAQASERGVVVRQAFVNLGEPWCGSSARSGPAAISFRSPPSPGRSLGRIPPSRWISGESGWTA